MLSKSYDALMDLIIKSDNIVALTGAGISTSSGIPDFRGPKGIYADPIIDGERIFDIHTFKENPKIFSNFFANLYPLLKDAQPSQGHYMLKKLEDMGKLKCIITQNIDGLHTKAGNSHVIEVHGHIREYVCVNSMHHRVGIDDIPYEKLSSGELIICDECQNYMKPDIVFFGEYIKDLEKALTEIQKTDLLLVIGTSLTVYPVAGLPDYCKDHTKLVIINELSTPFDNKADLVFRDDINALAERMGLVVTK
ncbi:NAD-dependent deacetylase [Brevinema andersonii]|uniref:protein acetyllysine N-acetyltransferase n=1 Tax=Brevinema andersonii TaxID=34097 RepID=A0A1I1EZJ7_BREAD|nr:Sir2 family NAD-dependent protein deacetylase [Brevinema andersonii]SFB90350.1 NAD-dependent deacetylase [Brevinema andersonii]